MENELIKNIEIVTNHTDYWFVRTDGGEHFEAFYEKNFIAIGWNEVTLSDILNKTEKEIKSKIARVNNIDTKSRSGKSKVTDIYNKIIRFKTLKQNDVIVIPSQNSEFLAFGIVQDNKIKESENTDSCPFIKRREVKWITKKDFESLDDAFYKVRKSRHAISNINDYADHVDSVMYTVYKKEDSSHFVVRVKKAESVNWLNLGNALVEMHKLLVEINEEFGLNEDVLSSSIKISIQSPGLFNLKQKGGVALVLLAMMLGSEGCSDAKGSLHKETIEQMDKFKSKREQEIENVKGELDTIGVKL